MPSLIVKAATAATFAAVASGVAIKWGGSEDARTDCPLSRQFVTSAQQTMATAVDSQCTAAAMAPTAGVDDGDGKALIHPALVGLPPDAMLMWRMLSLRR